MIFIGDIALPHKGAIELIIPEALKSRRWFGNLEGSVEEDDISESLARPVVFNHKDALKDLRGKFDLAGVALANNHITDTQAIDQTRRVLDQMNLPYVGAGHDIEAAQKPLLLDDKGTPIVILNFGWEPISCVVAEKSSEGVNPLLRDESIQQLKSAKTDYPERKLVVFLHWNYELEKYPQPFDRGLARRLIDSGADAVIGCHAHRPLGIETYNDKPIVYGLGNWLFPQNLFWNGKLKFPDFCTLQLAFEIDWDTNEFTCHWFKYEIEKRRVHHVQSNNLDQDPIIKEFSSFSEIPMEEYYYWFKKKRHHKKLLPIFKFEDSKVKTRMKIAWIQARHQIILRLRGLR